MLWTGHDVGPSARGKSGGMVASVDASCDRCRRGSPWRGSRVDHMVHVQRAGPAGAAVWVAEWAGRPP